MKKFELSEVGDNQIVTGGGINHSWPVASKIFFFFFFLAFLLLNTSTFILKQKEKFTRADFIYLYILPNALPDILDGWRCRAKGNRKVKAME